MAGAYRELAPPAAGRGAVLAGPDTGPVDAALAPTGTIVGARFAPGAGGAALGVPLAALRDERVPAAQRAARVELTFDVRGNSPSDERVATSGSL